MGVADVLWHLIILSTSRLAVHCNLQMVSFGYLSVCAMFSKDARLRSDFIWDFRKLPFPSHLGKYFITFGKISAKIHETEKIKTIFGLG